MSRQAHWNSVFTQKGEREVSWHESLPEMSLRMLEAAGLSQTTCVIDVGGGDSRLVDSLTSRGLDCLAVLDVSGAALQRASARLGDAAPAVTWIEADVTAAWSLKPMDIWHDRAVFHFLTEDEDRTRYVSQLHRVLRPGGAVVLATFDLDGPERCSGLEVRRYSAAELSNVLGDRLDIVESVTHTHTTPWGTTQAFRYSRFVKVH